MVSPLMEGAFTFGGTRFALGAAMQIPSLAAAELERKGTFTPERLAEAERFALNEYLTTLAGPPPRGEAARAFYARVAEITGMPLDVVTRTRGFIRDNYVKHLRARRAADRQPLRRDLHRPRSLSRKRERRAGPIRCSTALSRAYGGADVDLCARGARLQDRHDLRAAVARGQRPLGLGQRRPAATTPASTTTSASCSSLDPSFRLLVAHGYTDMVTPYAVSRYVLDHLPDLPNPARAQLKRLSRRPHVLHRRRRRAATSPPTRKSFYDAEP